ncbi:MAG: PQQ-dependent sugar dehydrogenase [Chloroflexota bacterium]
MKLRRFPFAPLLVCALALSFLLSACGGDSQQTAFQATLPVTLSSAPVYTATPTLSPSFTPTNTPIQTATPTSTETPTFTETPAATATATQTPTLAGTLPLQTLTPASNLSAPPAIAAQPAEVAPNSGWSCDDFPCENDIAGFLQKIHVPAGFTVEYVGQFPGQPMQITYGPDGRLYATVLEKGTRNGSIYAMNADGSSQLYSGGYITPIGLAFQPGTDALYVSARLTPMQRGAVFRVPSGGGAPQDVIIDLPCCYSLVDNQPDGMTFGADGYLYLGVGALSDHAENRDPKVRSYVEIQPNEASVLRIQPHTGAYEVYASGLRNPYDVAVGVDGQLYATDNGVIAGPGDRLVALTQGAHYGWPYWRTRGCDECPLSRADLTYAPDLLAFPNFTLPRGLVAYSGTQFPANYFGSLFVTLWNGAANAQRIVRIDPHDPNLGSADYVPEAFMTGLIRPVDVVVAPDGSLVVADFIYGHVWRVSYTG